MMDSNLIRKTFLDFFKSKQHTIVPSAPIINKDDPTLLFTNSGMNQFKDIFTGLKPAQYPRIADTQKCLRVSGKHNDLEEVGHDTYHHTMFEMLGNWSFGDYFRTEAIAWAWELLTEVYQIDKNRLYVTIFGGDEKLNLPADEESFHEWKKFIAEDRILRFGTACNFWEMGDTGPCGPCTEIHMDLRSDEDRAKIDGATLVNEGHFQVVELWNIVLMQFNRKADGSLETLKMKSVDTGMGFERLCMVLQGKQSNYDTDCFSELLKYLEENHCCIYGREKWESIAMRVAVDHIRAICFAIADGQLPSNTGAGYVIRRLIRRASRYGFKYLNIKRPFLYRMVSVLADKLECMFPELSKQKDFLEKVIEQEEKSFIQKLERGNVLFDEYIKNNPDNKIIDGKFAFELYDTFGFPVDLTDAMAREIEREVDLKGFEQHMDAQRERSKSASKVETGDWVEISEGTESIFIGYEHLSSRANIVKYRTVKTKKGDVHHIILDVTPFYAESGGQVGDTGTLTKDGETIQVLDTIRENETIIHICDKIPNNPLGEWFASVNADRRRKIRANHSATHLLQSALRSVLGTHVEQRGSLVNDEYLRFDFSHFEKMTDEQIKAVEKIVNDKIVASIPLQEYRNIPIAEAQGMGAMALFGEKYGEFVRVIRFGADYSTELCGGTHVNNTMEIRHFVITSESSIAAGIRRIEAITSDEAIAYLTQRAEQLERIRSLGKSNLEPEKWIAELIEKNKIMETKLEELRRAELMGLRDQLLTQIKSVNGVQALIENVSVESGEELKTLSYELRKKAENTIIVLGSVVQEKPLLSVILTEDLNDSQWDAKSLVNELAKEIKGGGGGQKFYATAGGKEPTGLANALEKATILLLKKD
jgi:alanyl-tRNA synthetase